MSRKGYSPDNSAMEGLFGRLKNEFFYGRDWEGVSLGDFASQLDDYMRYYRGERIKRSLGWMSPSQYRKSSGWAFRRLESIANALQIPFRNETNNLV